MDAMLALWRRHRNPGCGIGGEITNPPAVVDVGIMEVVMHRERRMTAVLEIVLNDLSCRNRRACQPLSATSFTQVAHAPSVVGKP